MVSLSCTATRVDGVTLVTGRVKNPDRPRRVRIENRLDGPVWPPRRGGVPVEGWDDGAFECVLAEDEVRPLGYASPATPADRPMRVASAEPVEVETVPEFGPRVDVPEVDGPGEVVRELDSPLPPRDAVAPTAGSARNGAARPSRTTERTTTGGTAEGEASAVAALEAAVAVVERRRDRRGRRTDGNLGTTEARLRRVADRVRALADRAGDGESGRR